MTPPPFFFLRVYFLPFFFLKKGGAVLLCPLVVSLFRAVRIRPANRTREKEMLSFFFSFIIFGRDRD